MSIAASVNQETSNGTISFGFTIRNQYRSSIATVKAAVENKAVLRKYQQDFFKSAVTKKTASGFVGYEFGDDHDQNRNKAFRYFQGPLTSFVAYILPLHHSWVHFLAFHNK